MGNIPAIVVVTPLMLAFAIPLVGSRWRNAVHPVATLGITISLAVALAGLFRVLINGNQHYYLGGWPPPLGIEYVLDPLSAVMISLVAFVGLVAVVFSRQAVSFEIPDRTVPFYGLVLLLLAGLTGIVITGDMFNLFVFLEIASLSAYALMSIGEQRAPVASFRYVVVGTIGGSFYLLGVGFLYFQTGSLNMADVARLLPSVYGSPATLMAVTLITVGLALKMALFPLHGWLPDAYTYTTSAAINFIAPIMTKVFAYALIRVLFTVFGPTYLRDLLPVTNLIGWLAAAGIIFGSIMAIAQRDLRRMLAYSSVSQLSYIALGIGLANPFGLIGALLHIINHAFMKGCLFMVTGGIRYRTGSSDIRTFTGLGQRMPWTMAAFALAALSMVGIPPTAGFFSKWYLVLGGIDAGNWVFVLVILVSSLLNVVYFFRLLERAYLERPSARDLHATARELPASMLAPTMALGVGTVILGLGSAIIVSRALVLALPNGL